MDSTPINSIPKEEEKSDNSEMDSTSIRSAPKKKEKSDDNMERDVKKLKTIEGKSLDNVDKDGDYTVLSPPNLRNWELKQHNEGITDFAVEEQHNEGITDFPVLSSPNLTTVLSPPNLRTWELKQHNEGITDFAVEEHHNEGITDFAVEEEMAEAKTEDATLVFDKRKNVTLHLPIFSDDVYLDSEKEKLLCERSLSRQLRVPVPLQANEVKTYLDKIIIAARISHLDKVELYFCETEDLGPFSPRNELEALSSVFSSINSLIPTSGTNLEEISALQMLLYETVSKIDSLGDDHPDSMIRSDLADDTAENLLIWAKNEGMRTKLEIACFQEAGRGAVASEQIGIGDIVLEIPESLIISETVIEADMSDVFKKTGNISTEEKYLLWIMKERHNSNSRFKPYFESLPEKFKTGLSFSEDALAALKGSQLDCDLVADIEFLKERFHALLESLRNIFPPELLTWDQYLWACELWYTNSMTVDLPDGNSSACLIPVAGFFNHSECPHILHNGRLESNTKSLKFFASRPCKKGEQCYISYSNHFGSTLVLSSRCSSKGGISGSQLLTFYGFLPEVGNKGGNAQDVIYLDLECRCSGEICMGGYDIIYGSSHMVRAAQNETFVLPKRLLDRIYGVMNCRNYSDFGTLPKPGEEYYPSAKDVLSRLHNTLCGLSLQLGYFKEKYSFSSSRDLSWDVKLALEYSDRISRVINFSYNCCQCGTYGQPVDMDDEEFAGAFSGDWLSSPICF